MRKCNVCDVELVKGKNWAVSQANNYVYICKPCKNKRNKQERLSTIHKPVVYFLPYENWVGTTENLKRRLWGHKHQYKRDTRRYVILREFDTREEAIEFEKILHNQGFKGKHLKGSYK